MIGAVAALLLTGQAVTDFQPVDPADWNCATPLIERNWQRTLGTSDRFILASDLADRIVDECARPYVARPIRSGSYEYFDRYMQGTDRSIYRSELSRFRTEILAGIGRARRQTIDLD